MTKLKDIQLLILDFVKYLILCSIAKNISILVALGNMVVIMQMLLKVSSELDSFTKNLKTHT